MVEAAWMGVTWRRTGAAHRRQLAALPLQPGVLRIATCARVGWLALGPGALAAMEAQRDTVGRADPAPDWLQGEPAIRHVFEVASGLDSAVQGERQVGVQVRAALAGAAPGPLRTVDHVLARLLATGRRRGWLRPGVSVASIGAERLGLGPGATAGVVGDGEMARLAVRHLARARVLVTAYNRTPRPGVLPLPAVAPRDGWIVATAAPAPWLLRPPGGEVVDLGQPPQVFGGTITLDTLLRERGLRLPPALAERAAADVDAAAAELLVRLDARLREVA